LSSRQSDLLPQRIPRPRLVISRRRGCNRTDIRFLVPLGHLTERAKPASWTLSHLIIPIAVKPKLVRFLTSRTHEHSLWLSKLHVAIKMVDRDRHRRHGI